MYGKLVIFFQTPLLFWIIRISLQLLPLSSDWSLSTKLEMIVYSFWNKRERWFQRRFSASLPGEKSKLVQIASGFRGCHDLVWTGLHSGHGLESQRPMLAMYNWSYIEEIQLETSQMGGKSKPCPVTAVSQKGELFSMKAHSQHWDTEPDMGPQSEDKVQKD